MDSTARQKLKEAVTANDGTETFKPLFLFESSENRNCLYDKHRHHWPKGSSKNPLVIA